MSNQLFDIIRETFSHPLSSSNIAYTPSQQIVLREGGAYPKINLAGIDLSGFTLKKATFEGASFQGANLSGVNFTGADLKGANFSGANISGAFFDDAKMDGANFSDVTFQIPPSGVNLGGDAHGR